MVVLKLANDPKLRRPFGEVIADSCDRGIPVSKNRIRVRILGTGINEFFEAVTHEIVGLPAGTYHKFTYNDGTVTYYNDFGVRSVSVEQLKP